LAWSSGSCGRRLGSARGIADADAKFVEGSKDVCVTAQEAGDEDSQQKDHERHDHDQSNHGISSSTCGPSINRERACTSGYDGTCQSAAARARAGRYCPMVWPSRLRDGAERKLHLLLALLKEI
jgi:hypothetical protein